MNTKGIVDIIQFGASPEEGGRGEPGTRGKRPMNVTLKTAYCAAAMLGALAVGSTEVSAMPINGLAQASASAPATPNVENVRWVCGPYRCFRRPNVIYRPGFYFGPRRFHGRYHSRRRFYGRRFGGWRR